jgi:hypothetical protein
LAIHRTREKLSAAHPVTNNGDWFVAVTTAPRKRCTLQECLDSIRNAGWEPTVFAEPGSTLTDAFTITNEDKKGVWHNWLASARYALEKTDAKLILTVQDDSLFHPESRQFVESIEWPSDAGFVSLYTAKHYSFSNNGELRPIGINRINTKSFWGSVALAWKREVLQAAVDSSVASKWLGVKPRSGSVSVIKSRRNNPALIANSDAAHGKIVRSLGLSVYCIDPSPVQHIAIHSTISHGGNTGRRNCYRCADHDTPLADQVLSDRINLSRFIASPSPLAGEVSLVTFHYNPAKFNRLRETYYEWLPSLGPLANSLRCYELVLDDDRPEIGGSTVIHGTRKANTLWQKEAIVNLALRETPAHIKYFAWIDHDIVLSNNDWLSDAVAKIDSGAVAVQLFSTVVRMNLDRTEILRKPSAMVSPQGSPGGMWIADRAYMDRIGGLNTYNIFGGGDQTFFDAMVGRPRRHLKEYSEATQNSLRKWIEFASSERHGRKADYIQSDGYHLWHGEHKDRQYGTRNKLLIDHDFDPQTDMRVGENGLLEWSSDKPGLHAGVARFFANRREDG